MAQDLGDYHATRLADLHRTTYTIYAGLSSTLPSLSGTNITAPGQSDYVRPALTFGNAAASRKISTTVVANFVNGGGNASGSAGNFGYVTLHDAASGGNFLGRITLDRVVSWVAGQPVTIDAGNITIDFSASA